MEIEIKCNYDDYCHALNTKCSTMSSEEIYGSRRSIYSTEKLQGTVWYAIDNDSFYFRDIAKIDNLGLLSSLLKRIPFYYFLGKIEDHKNTCMIVGSVRKDKYTRIFEFIFFSILSFFAALMTVVLINIPDVPLSGLLVPAFIWAFLFYLWKKDQICLKEQENLLEILLKDIV